VIGGRYEGILEDTALSDLLAELVADVRVGFFVSEEPVGIDEHELRQLADLEGDPLPLEGGAGPDRVERLTVPFMLSADRHGLSSYPVKRRSGRVVPAARYTNETGNARVFPPLSVKGGSTPIRRCTTAVVCRTVSPLHTNDIRYRSSRQQGKNGACRSFNDTRGIGTPS